MKHCCKVDLEIESRFSGKHDIISGTVAKGYTRTSISIRNGHLIMGRT